MIEYRLVLPNMTYLPSTVEHRVAQKWRDLGFEVQSRMVIKSEWERWTDH